MNITEHILSQILPKNLHCRNNDNINQKTETGVRGSEQTNQNKEGREQGFHKR